VTLVNKQATETPVTANFYRGGRFTWHQRRRHALVRQMMTGLEGKRVLDYGCGYGDLTFAISKTNPVIGIDVDANRIAFAREQYPELEFYEFDGETASFPDESFDVALSSVVLPFVSDPEAHLRDIRRLLVNQGQLILLSKNLPVVQNALRSLMGLPSVEPTLNIVELDTARNMLKSLGFSINSEGYFYDPPFSGWRGPKSAIVNLIEQLLDVARVSSAAGYWGLGAIACR
jgi:ubiquinone/menaquinone biosynthesis C-methylase UbiE